MLVSVAFAIIAVAVCAYVIKVSIDRASGKDY